MPISRRFSLKGQSISPGLVQGTAHLILRGALDVAEVVVPASRVTAECEALEQAVQDTIAELRELRDTAGKRMAGPVAKIFDAQLLVAGDYEFLRRVKDEIGRRKRNAGFVYNLLVSETLVPLKTSKDEYIRQMTIDIEAVARRVLSHLSGFGERSEMSFEPNTIIVSKLLTPGEILMFSGRKATGFVVDEGGYSSHMGLIARALALPVVVVSDATGKIADGVRIIVDAVDAEVIINPSSDDAAEYGRKKRKMGPALVAGIRKLTILPPKTRDGKEVHIAANLSVPGAADEILAEKKIPVGLYRTEFLYLEQGSFPDEATQFERYDAIAAQFAPSVVTLRAFDLGYDKMSPSDEWPHEDNPALGWRGIRALLDMSTVFRAQIRAILRASTRKNVRLMLPMVSDLSEIDEAKKIIAQEKFKLRKEGVKFDPDIKIGVMIEVPAAALAADAIARKVDFLSIGTNDLTQYTLAADRMNQRVAELYSPYHPAVLQLIRLTVEAGKRYTKPVSVCGEMAGDVLALPVLIGLGVDQLSMGAVRIYDLCRMVKRIDSGSARLLTTTVLAAGSLESALDNLQRFAAALEKT